MTQSDRVTIDFSWSVSPDEALELLAHHLKLASALFEVCPDGPQARQELARLFTSHDCPSTYIPIPRQCALAWWDLATRCYDDLASED